MKGKRRPAQQTLTGIYHEPPPATIFESFIKTSIPDPFRRHNSVDLWSFPKTNPERQW